MLKKPLTAFALISLLLALLLMPARFSAAVSEGLSLCMSAVIPSLFLFMCAAELIRRLHLLDRPGRRPRPLLPCLLLGIVCGYPIGAREVCAARQEGRLSAKQAAFALPLCAGASPAFLSAFVGQRLFSRATDGLLIWGISLLCSLAVNGLRYRRANRDEPPVALPRLFPDPPLLPTLLTAIGEAARTLFSVCALILFFSSLCSVMRGFLPEGGHTLYALGFGLIEMTSGLSLLHEPTPVNAALAGGLTALGGLSVTAQTLLFARRAHLSLRPYLWGRLLSAGATALICLAVFSARCGTY